jgi:hypothetical protein
MVGDKYIVVRKSDYERKVRGEDYKASANNAAEVAPSDGDLSRPALMKAGPLLQFARSLSARGAMKKGMRTRVWLWQKISNSQATTALTTVSALQPGSANDFSSFASLYDSARCHGMRFHTRCAEGTTTNGGNTAGVAFDPGTSGAVASVIGALEHTSHVGPMAVLNLGSAPSTVGVACESGFHVWRAPTVKLLESGLTADLVGGNWFPTGATSAIAGYLKPYVENAAAGTVTHLTFVAYDMEFMCRS